MHCPVYMITMRSTLCLEYQARARGESLPRKSIYSHPSEGSTLWAIKYKPCLTCETGRQVKENGGNDADVENLIVTRTETEARQLKRCQHCKQEKPLDEYRRNASAKDGKQKYCRECQSAAQKKSYQKLKEMNLNQSKAIVDQSMDGNAQVLPQDTVASNKTLVYKPSDTERKCQICKGTYSLDDDFTHEPNICDMCWEADRQMNTPIPPPVPTERTVESTPTHGERTCRRCGHQGPDTDFYMTGTQGYTQVCKSCAAKKRAETILEQAAMGLTPRPKLPANCVVLNFAEYPDLLENIRRAAKTNFRTVDNEILFRVVNYAINP